RVHMHTVVGAVDDYGVVSDAEIVKRFEQVPDVAIVFEHAVHVFAKTAAPLIFRAHMGVEMHACAVPPNEERFVGLDLTLDEVDRRVRCSVVDRLQSLSSKRTSVLDGLLADFAEAWVDGGIVPVGGFAL